MAIAIHVIFVVEGVEFWFQQDHEFDQPKGKVSFLIQTHTANSTAVNKVKTLLYFKSLEESINEWKYTASLAGLDFDFSFDERGIIVSVAGYSQHLAKLAMDLADRTMQINIDEGTFEIIKEDLRRDLRNTKHQKAYQKLIYELRNLSVQDTIHFQDYYDPEKNVDLIQSMTLKDVETFHKELFSQIFVSGLAYGNFEKK